MIGWCGVLLLIRLARSPALVLAANLSVTDTDGPSVFFEFSVETASVPGELWAMLTSRSETPSALDIKTGVGHLGAGTCRVIALRIDVGVTNHGITVCQLSFGGNYTLHAFYEGNGTHLLRRNFSVPEEPYPLPSGPYCFDVDRDYVGAKVLEVVADIPSAIRCQSLCAVTTGCLHFTFTYADSMPDFQSCRLLSTGPRSQFSSPAPGIIGGPKDCSSRSVLYFQGRGNLVYSDPRPIVSGIPFLLMLNGQSFDSNHDRIVLVPESVPCGEKIQPTPPSISASKYLVNGSNPATFQEWASMPCNGTGSATSLLVCGRLPQSVLFSNALGTVKACVCDAGGTPFGCDFQQGLLEYFGVSITANLLDVVGPFTSHRVVCPASRECTISGFAGYGMTAGDKMMLRESCSSQGSPKVKAYTGPSRPSPPGLDGGLYQFQEHNTVTCPPDHLSGPCETGRLCWCAARPGSTHSCVQETDFLVDAGEVIFYGAPSEVKGHAILQEDYQSFTLRWDYPSNDGGGAVTKYTIFFRSCPGGNYTDGVETSITQDVLPGDNRWGLARNATQYFRAPLFSAVPVPVTAATRYCIKIIASNPAGTSQKSKAIEFTWLTDVPPPTDLVYPSAPLYLIENIPMSPIAPQVTTQDCSSLPSVANIVPQLHARDCQVQHYDIIPALPEGLVLDPQTGVISGTSRYVTPRPEIYQITATNAGGKTSTYISIGIAGLLSGAIISLCMNSFVLADVLMTFRMPLGRNAAWLGTYSDYPQVLRLTVYNPLKVVPHQVSGERLGFVPRSGAIGCGALLVDAWSNSENGFPPPTMCHWQDNEDESLGLNAKGARIDMHFQGGATFEAGQLYQLVLKLRVSHLTDIGDNLLFFEFFASEWQESERRLESEIFGSWTPITSIEAFRPAISPKRASPIPVPPANSPWFTGRPRYEPGFTNMQLGDGPTGLPYPHGFPAPGVTTCFNSTSQCATSPHQYAGEPGDTAWYRHVEADVGVFPAFAALVGNVSLASSVMPEMPFNPFAKYKVTAVGRSAIAAGRMEPVFADRQGFQLEFALTPDVGSGVTLERHLTICPSGMLRSAPMSLSPVCELAEGPSYISCECSPILGEFYTGAARCDRFQITVSTSSDPRATVTASFSVSTGTLFWPGYQPSNWYVQIKTRYGGLYSFRKVQDAGLTISHDFLLVQTTPELCAQECLKRLSSPAQFPIPCRSFKFHKIDKDCYLSQHIEDLSNALKRDWPGNVYDHYEHLEQLVFAAPTPEPLFFQGPLVSEALLHADTYLQPPQPAAPPFDVPHFFPSYVEQPQLLFRLELVMAVPIHGQEGWSSRVNFMPPPGFVAIALSAAGGVPLPLGRGWCPVGRCSWLLTKGQSLWQGPRYTFSLLLNNPLEPQPAGQNWYVQVAAAGTTPLNKAQEGLSLVMKHPLAVDGYLLGCAAHYGHEIDNFLDIYFVLAKSWPGSSRLRVVLPKAFPVPPSCSAKLLTPWLRAGEVACYRSHGNVLYLNFTAPMSIGAAVGLRLTQFQLPSDFAAVRPGFIAWPAELQSIQPASLNVRLESVPVEASPLDQGDVYACHPAVWSCGLHTSGWASEEVLIRPGRESFKEVSISLAHVEPLREQTSWALLEFSVNTTFQFFGLGQDVLKIIPPYGYSLLGVHDSNIQILRRLERSGQLNVQEVVDVQTGLGAAYGAFLVNVSSNHTGAAIRIPSLFGEMRSGELQYINLSFAFPSDGVEPSLLNPLERNPKHSGCTNAWGVSLESSGEPLASAFVAGQPLAVLDHLTMDCTCRAAGAEQLLSVRFRTTARAQDFIPIGSSLVMALTLPQHVELLDPAVAADFAAPFLGIGGMSAIAQEGSSTLLESSRLEQPSFRRLGCAGISMHSDERRLRQEVAYCAVLFNDLQDRVELLFNASFLMPSSTNEIILRVRNPPRTGPVPKASLSVYRSTPDFDLNLILMPTSLSSQGGEVGGLVPLQIPLEAAPCEQILRPMQAEVFASTCNLAGMKTEVSIGFVAPAVMKAPIRGTIKAPVGYSLQWDCSFEATKLLLPGGRTLDYLSATSFSDCIVNPDGLSASFVINTNIKAISSWTFFTIHAHNPGPDQLPVTDEQQDWALQVGDIAAAGDGIGGAKQGRGMQSPRLQVFTALSLSDLPVAYSSNVRALVLRFRSATAIPSGGYFRISAPTGFAFPGEQCQRPTASNQKPGPGFSSSVPLLPSQPFMHLPDPEMSTAFAASQGSDTLSSMCEVLARPTNQNVGQELLVALLQGTLEPGYYELRFVVEISTSSGADRSPALTAPLRWSVDSWRPGSLCDHSCCPPERANFRTVVGMPDIQLLDQGVLHARLAGPAGPHHYQELMSDGEHFDATT